MVLDAHTFFRALLFVMDMQWDADTAPRDGEEEDAALRQHVQKRGWLRKLFYADLASFMPYQCFHSSSFCSGP